jgi:hypothetical protein
MKRSTPEQQARAAERREKFKKIAKQISALTPEQRQAMAARCWPTTVEGPPLSVTNACLVGLQMPGATLVGGFRQWIKAGRAVRKGEHGISIWIPGGAPKSDDLEAGDTDIRFLMGTVFDVSQTQEIAESEAA